MAVSLTAVLLTTGGVALAPRVHATGDAKLVGAQVSFHTNDEDKDDDTHVTVTVRDQNNVVAAVISSDFEHYDDNSDHGPYQLTIQNASSWYDLRAGTTTIDIDPNGNDTWRFNFNVDLTFSDGSHLGNQIGGVELSEERTSNSWSILPPTDDYYSRMDFGWIPQPRTVADSARLAQDRQIPPLLWEGCMSPEHSGKGEGYMSHVLAEVGLLRIIENPDGRAELTRAFNGTPSPIADPRHIYQDCLDRLATNWRLPSAAQTDTLSTTPGWTKVIADVRHVPALSGKPGTDDIPSCRTKGGDQDEWDFTMALMTRVWGFLKQEPGKALFGADDPAKFDQLRRDVADRAWLQGSKQDVDATVCNIAGVAVPETENHELLIRTTRFLHNESLPMVTPPDGAYVSIYDKDTNTDNNANGVSGFLHGKLNGTMANDWIEYNARGYSRYQMIALLNLYDFAADPSIRADAKKVLDFLALKHVSESEDSKRIAPFRRKAEKQSDLLFGVDPVDPMFEQLIGGLPQRLGGDVDHLRHRLPAPGLDVRPGPEPPAPRLLPAFRRPAPGRDLLRRPRLHPHRRRRAHRVPLSGWDSRLPGGRQRRGHGRAGGADAAPQPRRRRQPQRLSQPAQRDLGRRGPDGAGPGMRLPGFRLRRLRERAGQHRAEHAGLPGHLHPGRPQADAGHRRAVRPHLLAAGRGRAGLQR
jgi:hypothetical protein